MAGLTPELGVLTVGQPDSETPKAFLGSGRITHTRVRAPGRQLLRGNPAQATAPPPLRPPGPPTLGGSLGWGDISYTQHGLISKCIPTFQQRRSCDRSIPVLKTLLENKEACGKGGLGVERREAEPEGRAAWRPGRGHTGWVPAEAGAASHWC